ncbi:MAG TPA: opacity family porin [Ignavibacteria bacterium]|nr:opacity family porin [Ignavibacteria bacterium]
MKYILAALVITFVFLGEKALSQPTGTVQFYGGYSIPMGDLKGEFGNTFDTWTGNGNPDTNTYFMKSGINYGIYVKFPVKRKSPVQITGGIGFDVFSNSKIYDDNTGAADISLTQSHLAIVLGAEYNFATKKSKLNPFIGAEAMLNVIGGKLTIIYPTETKDFSMNSTMRIGLQLAAGLDIVVHNNIGIVLGGKYAFANLVGKSYEPDFGTQYNLGDAEHENNGATYPAKNIQYLHLYGGLSFYFGR